jgi:hypothetical protein
MRGHTVRVAGIEMRNTSRSSVGGSPPSQIIGRDGSIPCIAWYSPHYGAMLMRALLRGCVHGSDTSGDED